jgi:hypothetical protein
VYDFEFGAVGDFFNGLETVFERWKAGVACHGAFYQRQI